MSDNSLERREQFIRALYDSLCDEGDEIIGYSFDQFRADYFAYGLIVTVFNAGFTVGDG